MGITYHYANLKKREWFAADALGGGSRLEGLGLSLTARAFDLLLVRSTVPQPLDSSIVGLGRWCGDSIAFVGDNDDEWPTYTNEFADLSADIILLVCQYRGFDLIAAEARNDPRLFRQVCHLIVTRQAPELEPDIKRHFGANYLQQYKQSCSDIHPLDLYSASKNLLRTIR